MTKTRLSVFYNHTLSFLSITVEKDIDLTPISDKQEELSAQTHNVTFPLKVDILLLSLDLVFDHVSISE